MASNTVLITGGNGQLGRELSLVAERFAPLRFVATDLPELDITNAEAIDRCMADLNPRYVVNCAAYTAVDAAESDEQRALALNGHAPALLANACKQHGAQLIHVSTDYVFDGRGHRPYAEDAPTAPLSAYGRTKLTGEQAVMQSGVGTVVRTAWLYSPFGNNFVKTMLRLSRERQSISVVADQVGSPTYAHDLAMAIGQMMASGKLSAGIYHYTNAGVCSWYDFAHEIMRLTNRPCRIEPIATEQYPTPAIRPCYSVLSKSKIQADFGIDIPHWTASLEHCLKRLID